MNEKKLVYMQEGGQVLKLVLDEIKSKIKPGIRTKEIDDWAKRLCLKYKVKPSFLGYQNYPAAICVSINDEVVHGLPGQRTLKEGDLVSLDMGVYFKGYHTDAAITFELGKITKEGQALINIANKALMIGIDEAYVGNHIGDIGYAIQNFVEDQGYGVIRTLVGHSIGRNIHEDPLIPNFGSKGSGAELKKGMTLAIEPMIAIGDYEVFQEEDGWTYKTKDGSLAAHFEHTIYIERHGPIILTG